MRKYCIAPFASPAITPDGFKVCSYPGQKVYDDISFWNSEEIMEMRRTIREGGTPESCIECRKGRDGLVCSANPDDVRDEYVPLNFKNLFIARSNKCDMACEMCSSTISHTYDKVHGDGSVGVIENNIDLTPYLHETTHAAISGGNPVLDNKLLDIIDGLDADRLRSMFFTSNGSVFPKSFIDSIKRLSKTDISLIFSIDGPKYVNEVVRERSRQQRFYDTFQRVMQDVIEHENIFMCIEFTATNKTVSHLSDLYDEMMFMLSTDELSRVKFIFNVCSSPVHLSAMHLTAEQENSITKQLSYFEHVLRTAPTELASVMHSRLYDFAERYNEQRIL
ncbi:radical SAM domain-containing protein [Vibrio phage F86]